MDGFFPAQLCRAAEHRRSLSYIHLSSSLWLLPFQFFYSSLPSLVFPSFPSFPSFPFSLPFSDLLCLLLSSFIFSSLLLFFGGVRPSPRNLFDSFASAPKLFFSLTLPSPPLGPVSSRRSPRWRRSPRHHPSSLPHSLLPPLRVSS